MGQSPASVRLGSTGPGGYIEPSGLAALIAVLREPGVVSVFHTWRSQQLTQLVAGALRDLILHQPMGIANEDRLVQYGVTQGLELAFQLMSDPSVIVPGLFTGGATPGEARPAGIPDENFDTPADGAS